MAVRKKTTRTSRFYRDGVVWIALNDDATELSAETVADQLTVVLLADVFGYDPADVAADVMECRLLYNDETTGR